MQADCFILCYSKADRTSFDNIRTKWYPELEPYCCPIVLVGKIMIICVCVICVQTKVYISAALKGRRWGQARGSEKTIIRLSIIRVSVGAQLELEISVYLNAALVYVHDLEFQR